MANNIKIVYDGVQTRGRQWGIGAPVESSSIDLNTTLPDTVHTFMTAAQNGADELFNNFGTVRTDHIDQSTTIGIPFTGKRSYKVLLNHDWPRMNSGSSYAWRSELRTFWAEMVSARKMYWSYWVYIDELVDYGDLSGFYTVNFQVYGGSSEAVRFYLRSENNRWFIQSTLGSSQRKIYFADVTQGWHKFEFMIYLTDEITGENAGRFKVWYDGQIAVAKSPSGNVPYDINSSTDGGSPYNWVSRGNFAVNASGHATLDFTGRMILLGGDHTDKQIQMGMYGPTQGRTNFTNDFGIRFYYVSNINIYIPITGDEETDILTALRTGQNVIQEGPIDPPIDPPIIFDPSRFKLKMKFTE